MNKRLMCGFLLLPIVWWNGKWLAPDFFAMACAVVAGSLLSRKSRVGDLFFLGAAAGLRLSNLATLSGSFVLAVTNQRFTFRSIPLSVLAVVGGYVAANPFILTDFSVALENAGGIVPTAEMTWTHVFNVMSSRVVGNRREWDLASGKKRCQNPIRGFLGRPSGRNVDSSPRRRAVRVLHGSSPNGLPRRTLRRTACNSASVCGAFT